MQYTFDVKRVINSYLRSFGFLTFCGRAYKGALFKFSLLEEIQLKLEKSETCNLLVFMAVYGLQSLYLHATTMNTAIHSYTQKEML
jgi:hypothetical protein